MNAVELTINRQHMERLLSAASGDAAILYLYLRSGNDLQDAQEKLHMTAARVSDAAATLRQMGLWEEKREIFIPGERPNYSETDVIRAMDTDVDFRALYGEVQRLLGKSLNTEEMKILLGFVRYLGFSGDVISVLVCYCKERARQRGSLRNPSLRTIEKEAYAWAEMGIDSISEAAAYIRAQNIRGSQLGKYMKKMGIQGRQLTPGEEKFAKQWLDMGFGEDAIAIAYERTCVNTGGLKWPYMNSILQRWHEAGLHTAEEIKQGDKKPKVPKGASGTFGQAELDAVARMMQEDENGL